MNLMIIMRGIPGSGKSTLANKFVSDIETTIYGVNIYSTDDFWYDENDQYVFDIKKLSEAHAWNYHRVDFDINEYDVVIIDNTNIVWRDFKEYVVLAVNHGYNIMLAEPQTDWKQNVDECDIKNTHNVPKWVIDKMLDKYQSNAEIIGCTKSIMDVLGHHVDIYEYDPMKLF